MKAMILAAGLGTRLKPWTEKHPKALVPVGGVPMLERVICSLRDQGFDDLVINVHHFAEQVREFVREHDFGVRIRFSDESELLLDTGGAVKKAAPLLFDNADYALIHNVDILSNADLCGLMLDAEERQTSASLLVSERDSSRQLLFDDKMELRGWRNLKTDEYKNCTAEEARSLRGYAFSGIHVISRALAEQMDAWPEKFSIIDFYLAASRQTDIAGSLDRNLNLIDIGKPETLARANDLF